MKKILFVAILLFNGMLFAQSNYQPGFIIKNTGDTLKGFVDVKEWGLSPKFVDFKDNLAYKNPTKFYPQSIKGFQAAAEIYVSYLGPISLNKTDVTELSNGVDTSKKVDTTFIKQVAGGNNVNLFYQKDHLKTRYFIAYAAGQPTELLYSVSINESNLVQSSLIYKGQLIVYVNKFKPGNQKLISLLNDISYNQDDLEHVVNELNDTHISVQKKGGYRLYAGVGANFTTTDIDGSKSHGVTPKINFGVDIFNNKEVQRLFLRADLSFFYVTPSPATGSAIDPVVGGYDTYSFSFNQFNVSFSPEIIYNFYNANNFKLFIGAGIAFNLAHYTNNKYIYTVSGGSQAVNEFIGYENYYTSFPLEAGLVLNKKLEINLTYILKASFTKQIYFYANNQVDGLSIKYLFGK